MKDNKKTDLSNLPLSAIEQSAPHLSDADVNLLKLWRTLAKRKGVVFAVLLISLIVAGFSIFLAPSVYESHAVLQIGRTENPGLVEIPSTVAKRVMVQDDLSQDQTATGNAHPFVYSAFVHKTTNLVSIIARGPAPDVTRNYLAQVVEKVIHEHQELVDLALKQKQQSLDLIQKRVQLLEGILEDQKKIAQMTNNPLDPLIQKQNTDSGVSTQLNIFENQQMQIEHQRAMSALILKPTTLIKAPTLSVVPVKPRPLLYLALAIGIGLMLGVFGALATEFISKARRFAAT